MNNPETRACRARHRLFPLLTALVLIGWSAMVSAQTDTRIISLSGNMDFGTVAFGSYTERVLTISNAGNSTLTVSNISVSSPPEPVYLFAGFGGTWSGTIAPGASQQVLITFAPGSSLNAGGNASFDGLLSVESDATDGNASIPVEAVGTFSPPVASISLSEANLNFGNLDIGTLKALPLVISNSGNSVLTISNVTLPGGFFPPLPLPGSNTVLATLGPGMWTNFFVLFHPTNVGNYAGTATINSDATAGKSEFTVSGQCEYATGRYIGLFYPELANTALDNSGQFSANVGRGGAVSGLLQLAGYRYPFSGRFSGAGAFSVQLTNGLYISFQELFGLLEGSVSNDTWVARLSAYHPEDVIPKPFDAMKPGKYQIAIAGSADPLLGPTNGGTGTISISASHAVHLSGTLGDGTQFSQGTILCGDSQVPFYASLYGGQGVVLGWINCVVLTTNSPAFPVPQIPGTNIILTNIVLTNFPPLTNIPPLTNTLPFTNIIVPTNFPALTNLSPLLIERLSVEPALNFLSRTNHGPTPAPRQISGTNIIFGEINWFKPPQIDSNYPSGFSFQTSVSGPLP